jgi:hypothetical protein
MGAWAFEKGFVRLGDRAKGGWRMVKEEEEMVAYRG